MRHLILSFLFMALAKGVSAHAFYFAYAEVEYNPSTSKLEASVKVTSHDFELFLLEKLKPNARLTEVLDNPTNARVLSELMFQNFSIFNDGEALQWNWEGYFSDLQGYTTIYLSSSSFEWKQLSVSFNLLMSQFPEQQNKLTFLFKGKKNTFDFLPNPFVITLNRKDYE